MSKEKTEINGNNLRNKMKSRRISSRQLDRQKTLDSFLQPRSTFQKLYEMPESKPLDPYIQCKKESEDNQDSLGNENRSRVIIKTEVIDEASKIDDNVMDYEYSDYFIYDSNSPTPEVQIKSEYNDKLSALMDKQSSEKTEASKNVVQADHQYFYCDECGYQTIRKNILLAHIKKEHIDEFKENLSDCLKCGKHFKSVINKRKHESLCGRFLYTCSICGKQSKFAHVIKDHLRGGHCQKLRAGEFEKIYKAILNQRKEQRAKVKKQIEIEENAAVKEEEAKNVTKDLIKLHCNKCKKTIDRVRQHNKVINKCPDCGTFLKTKCAKCKKIFSSQYIHKHLRIVCDVRQYLKCQQCDYVATWSHHMKCHMKKHHSGAGPCQRSTKKYFQCDKCEFRTQYKYHFQEHGFEHREIDKKPLRDSLNVQIVPKIECKVESDSNPKMSVDTKPARPIKTWKFFYCKECEFTSTSKESVRSHVLNKHSKEFDENGTIKCPTCSKIFQRLHAFKKHKLMCGFISYKCEYCSESWSKSKDIYRHLKVQHKLLDQEVAEKVYNEILRKANELRDEMRQSIADEKKTIIRVTNDMIKLYCSKCDETFDRVRERGNSFLKNCSKCDTFLQSKCSKCGKLSETARLIWTHVVSCFQRRDKHLIPDLESNENLQQKDNWSEIMYNCDHCDFSGKEKKDLRWHIRAEHAIEYKTQMACKYCPFTTPYKTSYKRHMKSSH